MVYPLQMTFSTENSLEEHVTHLLKLSEEGKKQIYLSLDSIPIIIEDKDYDNQNNNNQNDTNQNYTNLIHKKVELEKRVLKKVAFFDTYTATKILESGNDITAMLIALYSNDLSLGNPLTFFPKKQIKTILQLGETLFKKMSLGQDGYIAHTDITDEMATSEQILKDFQTEFNTDNKKIISPYLDAKNLDSIAKLFSDKMYVDSAVEFLENIDSQLNKIYDCLIFTRKCEKISSEYYSVKEFKIPKIQIIGETNLFASNVSLKSKKVSLKQLKDTWNYEKSDNNGKNNNKVPEDTRLKVFANSYKLTHLKKDVGIKLLDDIIIQNHLPLVFYALNFLKNEHHFRLKNDNNVLQNGDLFMMGVLGLTQATQRYDPSKIYSKNGQIVKFQTYALTRIKGAIIDELRTCNFLPANVMGELSAIEKVEKKFINIHLEFPSASELSYAYLHSITPSKEDINNSKEEKGGLYRAQKLVQLYQSARMYNSSNFLSLNKDTNKSDEEVSLIEVLKDPSSKTPAEIMEEKEKQEIISHLIQNNIKKSDRDILATVLYFCATDFDKAMDYIGLFDQNQINPSGVAKINDFYLNSNFASEHKHYAVSVGNIPYTILGELLNVTTSRVSQIIDHGKVKLAKLLNEQGYNSKNLLD